jgi:hypothetical protein
MNALRVASTAASAAAESTPIAASTRNDIVATARELPAIAATATDAAVKAGPYTDVVLRHPHATARVAGSCANRAGGST